MYIVLVGFGLIALAAFAMFSITNTGKKFNEGMIYQTVKGIGIDLIQDWRPLTYSILTNKMERRKSLRPFLTLGKKVKIVFQALVLGLLALAIGIGYNIASVKIVGTTNTSPFAMFQTIFHSIWIGLIIILAIDFIWRVFMLFINQLYGGLSEEGYASITGKFLSVGLVLMILLTLVFMPEKYLWAISFGIDIALIWQFGFGLTIIGFVILMNLLLSTMSDPTSLASKDASRVDTKDVTAQVIKGGLLIMLFLFLILFSAAVMTTKVWPGSFLGETENIRLFYFTVTTMTTVGYGDISPSLGVDYWVNMITQFTSVIAIGMFVGSVFTEHELEDEDEVGRALRTQYLYVDEMTTKQLRDFASNEGIKIPANASKERMIETIQELFK